MKEKEYAVVALKDILHRALLAVQKQGFANCWDMVGGESDTEEENYAVEGSANMHFGGQPLLEGWDLEFALMSREEQAEWLVRLFEVLIEHG